MILKVVLSPPHSLSGMHVSILSPINTCPMYNTQSPTEKKKAAIKPLVHDQELFCVCTAYCLPLPPLPLSALGLLYCLLVEPMTSLQHAISSTCPRA